MVATVLPHHPPAVKVGGRRLSISTRPKAQAAPENAADSPTETKEEAEDEGTKKDKKNSFSNEKYAQRKAENTRPTRDTQGNFKAFAGARIAQPAGKAFGV